MDMARCPAHAGPQTKGCPALIEVWAQTPLLKLGNQNKNAAFRLKRWAALLWCDAGQVWVLVGWWLAYL